MNYKRQLEILSWCSDFNFLEGALNNIAHPDFRYFYTSNNLSVFIVPVNLLAEYYNSNIGIDPNNPNLYIALFSHSRLVAIEISIDVTSVIHAILRQRTLPTVSLKILTNDKTLEQEIVTVYTDFRQYIQQFNLPCKIIIDRNDISLPIPTDGIREYRKQLEWLAKHVVSPKDNQLVGAVARRLRSLDMVSDVGSIRGVFLSDYNANTGRDNWETLNLLDRAEHEGRIIGSGRLNLFNIIANVIVISRDKFIDEGGYYILVIGIGKPYVITINGNDIKDTFLFNGEVSDYVDTMEDIDVNKAFDNYEDNLRVEGWLLVLLKFVGMNYQDVSKITLRQFLIDDYAIIVD